MRINIRNYKYDSNRFEYLLLISDWDTCDSWINDSTQAKVCRRIALFAFYCELIRSACRVWHRKA